MSGAILTRPQPQVTRLGARSADAALVSIYLIAFFALWLLLPVLTGKDVPGDNLEQLNWALAPALGYAKHPPFPTWVLWSFERVFPADVPLTYALGALEVAGLLALVWHIGCLTLDRRRALLAVLCVSCVSYYSFRMHFYNHNTALLVATAASLPVLWRCVESNAIRWWVLLGLVWGIGMLCKYQMAVTIACNVAFLMTESRARLREQAKGILVAAIVAGFVVLPHIVWLVQNDFPTFTYASKSLAAHAPWSARPGREMNFLADQLLRLANLIPVLLALAWVARGRSAGSVAVPAQSQRFLAIHAFGPFAIMTLLSMFFGVDLQMHWGTAFLWAVPLWLAATPWGARIAALDVRVILACVSGAQVLMAAGFALRL
jgi:4-amino-4-deoxy-L-arabinose transferase-like glycosyltransferase